jgi:hypothetical protein
MFRTAVATAVLAVAMAVPASAQTPILPLGKAKAIAAQQARKVKQDLADEGARRAKVPGCWRRNARKVSCYFAVYGYDAEQDFHWKCMLRINIKLRHHPSRKHGLYKFSYGRPVCG